jgi:hypothetical protein
VHTWLTCCLVIEILLKISWMLFAHFAGSISWPSFKCNMYVALLTVCRHFHCMPSMVMTETECCTQEELMLQNYPHETAFRACTYCPGQMRFIASSQAPGEMLQTENSLTVHASAPEIKGNCKHKLHRRWVRKHTRWIVKLMFCLSELCFWRVSCLVCRGPQWALCVESTLLW